MGAAVSAVRDEAAKESAQKEKEANDALTALQDLAKLQVDIFRATVRNDKDPLKLSINKMISDESIIKCGVTTGGDDIAKAVEETYSAFASGNIAKGIGSVLSAGLKALFGNSAGNSNQTQKYFITVGSLGFPMRIDMFLYTYAFTSSTLTKVTKNVLATSITVSSIDPAALDEGTIGATVQFCYGAADQETQKKIFNDLLKIHKDAVESAKNKPKDVLHGEQEDAIRQAINEIRQGGEFE